MIIAGVERGFGFWALGEFCGVDVLGNDGSGIFAGDCSEDDSSEYADENDSGDSATELSLWYTCSLLALFVILAHIDLHTFL